MMKKIFFCFVIALIGINQCYALGIDDIDYTLDKVNKTATITDINKSGVVIIPTSISYKNLDTGKDDEYIVTSIKENANASAATSLIIPNTVTSIGNNAFKICPTLVEVSIPESITSIGSGVLKYCPNLKKVIIPSSLTSIANDALCSSNNPSPINTIIVSNLNSWYQLMSSRTSTLSSGYNLYVGEELITDIKVPSDVTTIKRTAYSGCISLVSITIPNHVTTIEANAFDGCVNVKDVTIPSSVSIINENVFSSLQLDFLKLNSELSGTSISTSSWWPQSVDKVIIGDDVSALSKGFSNCHMNSIYIPSSLTALNSSFGYESGHINNCALPHLSEVHINDLAAWCNISFGYSKIAQIYYCVSNPLSVAKHLYMNGVELSDLVIPSSVISISPFAFQGGEFNSISIPSSVTSIGKNAFSSSIKSIEFHNNIESLSNWGITNAKSIIIGNEVETYDLSDVRNFTDLKCLEFHCKRVEAPLGTFVNIQELILGEGVEYVSAEAFSSNGMNVERKLTSIVVDSNNQVLDSRNNCNAVIRKVDNQLILGCNNTILPEDIHGIDDNALKNLKGLTNIVIPGLVTSIGEATFHLDTELTSATLPNHLTSIGERAFGACVKLSKIDIPGSVTTLGEGAFYSCQALTSVIIPPLVTTISKMLFSGASNLASVTLPNTITDIEQEAFYNCQSLTSIVISDQISAIGNYAFYGCSNLTAVTIKKASPLSISDNVFSNRSNAILYVPKGSKPAYQIADYWNEFKEIRELGDEFQQGDVNNDGQVDTQDAILVIQRYLGETPSVFSEGMSDMNNDGNIDTQDAILIIERYLSNE